MDMRLQDIGTPLPDDLQGAFEAATAIEVVEHLLLPRELLRRAREALVPGGRLIITTPYHGYVKNVALALTGRFDTHWHPLRNYGHVEFFSRPTLTALSREEGLSRSSGSPSAGAGAGQVDVCAGDAHRAVNRRTRSRPSPPALATYAALRSGALPVAVSVPGGRASADRLGGVSVLVDVGASTAQLGRAL